MASPQRARGSESVILVDDEPSVLKLFTRLLRRAGFQVTPFSNPTDALRAFEANSTDFDIVVSDYNMPELTGTELAAALQRVVPGLPIVLVSGFGDLLEPDALRAAGIFSLVTKPPESGELAANIRAALDAPLGQVTGRSPA